MSHGDWDHRSYATIPYPPAAEVWPVVMERDDTCRKSLDESLVLVKWEGALPSPLSGSVVYDHAGILVVMATPAWTDPDPFPPEDP